MARPELEKEMYHISIGADTMAMLRPHLLLIRQHDDSHHAVNSPDRSGWFLSVSPDEYRRIASFDSEEDVPEGVTRIEMAVRKAYA